MPLNSHKVGAPTSYKLGYNSTYSGERVIYRGESLTPMYNDRLGAHPVNSH